MLGGLALCYWLWGWPSSLVSSTNLKWCKSLKNEEQKEKNYDDMEIFKKISKTDDLFNNRSRKTGEVKENWEYIEKDQEKRQNSSGCIDEKKISASSHINFDEFTDSSLSLYESFNKDFYW